MLMLAFGRNANNVGNQFDVTIILCAYKALHAGRSLHSMLAYLLFCWGVEMLHTKYYIPTTNTLASGSTIYRQQALGIQWGVMEIFIRFPLLFRLKYGIIPIY